MEGQHFLLRPCIHIHLLFRNAGSHSLGGFLSLPTALIGQSRCLTCSVQCDAVRSVANDSLLGILASTNTGSTELDDRARRIAMGSHVAGPPDTGNLAGPGVTWG